MINNFSFPDAVNVSAEHWMFQQEALQEYLLICCQHIRGGLIDKPGKYVPLIPFVKRNYIL